MDIAHILKNKSTDSINIEIEIYRDENDKAHIFIAEENSSGETHEVYNDDDLIKVVRNYICN